MKTARSAKPRTVGSHGSSVLTVAITDFQAGMEKFVSMFTDNYGLRLVFRGTDAMTDGKTIYVPELSLLSRPAMTEEEIHEALRVLMTTRGFIYHEGWHVIDSDFDLVEKAMREHGLRFKLLLNMLEDCRIERKGSDIYPGMREALIFTNEWTFEKVAEQAFGGTEPDPEMYVQLLYAIGLIGNIVPNATNLPIWKKLARRAKDKALKYETEILQAKNANTTQEAYDIALLIWADLVKEDAELPKPPPVPKPSPKKPPPGEKGESDDDGEGASGEGEESDEESDGGGEASEDDAADSGDGESEEEGDDAATSSGSGAGEKGDEEEGTATKSKRKKKGKKPKKSEEESSEKAHAEDEGEPGGGTDMETETGEAYEETGEETSLRLGEEECDEPRDKSDALEEFVRQAADKLAASLVTSRYRPYSTENDTIEPPPEPRNAKQRQSLRQEVKELTDEVRSHFGPITRQVENLLKARAQSYYVRGLEEGELDQSNLHRLAVSNQVGAAPELKNQARMVFMQKVKARSLDETACGFSIDMSGSMGMSGPGSYTSKDHLARQCVIIFAHALEAVKIPFEVTAWSTTPHGTSTESINRIRESCASEPQVTCEIHEVIGLGRRRGGYSGDCPACMGSGLASKKLQTIMTLYTRFGGLRILEVKRFAEKWQQVDWRLTHVRGYHANYDGESVLLAARRLMQRKEKRKVLFVMCDGIPGPDYYESSQIHATYLHEVIKEIRATTPIELIGIGIAAPEAGEFYRPRFINVSNVEQLPGVVASQLKQVLLR